MQTHPLPQTAHATGGSWVEEGGMFGRWSRSVLVTVGVTSLFGALFASTASADPVKCKAEIIKSSAAFLQAKAKALAKCEEKTVKGQPQGDCHLAAQATIAKAVAKFQKAIDKKCGGKDKLC